MKLKHLLPALAILAVAGLSSCNNSAQKQEEANVEAVNEADMKPDKPFKGVLEVTDDNIPTTPGIAQFIDFNATWCGPCQDFAPIFHAVAARYEDKADFYSVDTDVNPNLAEAFKVEAIPMIVGVAPDGTQEVTIGFMDEAAFEAFVRKVMGE